MSIYQAMSDPKPPFSPSENELKRPEKASRGIPDSEKIETKPAPHEHRA